MTHHIDERLREGLPIVRVFGELLPIEAYRNGHDGCHHTEDDED